MPLRRCHRRCVNRLQAYTLSGRQIYPVAAKHLERVVSYPTAYTSTVVRPLPSERRAGTAMRPATRARSPPGKQKSSIVRSPYWKTYIQSVSAA